MDPLAIDTAFDLSTVRWFAQTLFYQLARIAEWQQTMLQLPLTLLTIVIVTLLLLAQTLIGAYQLTICVVVVLLITGYQLFDFSRGRQ